MATLAATIIIEGKKYDEDADLLKNLKLYTKVRNHDQHKIGRANIHYHDALTSRDEVFVGSIGNNTIICSDNIPSDFIGGLSTLKNGVFTLFPKGRKVVFFSNTTSLLNGFVVYKDQKLVRMKIVQNGKLEKISFDDLDFGDFLENEEKYYEADVDIKKSHDYLWGLHDMKIAAEYIESNFGIDGLEQQLDDLVCNKYTPEQITAEELARTSQEKLTVKHIHTASDQFIESKFSNLTKEKTKDEFPSVSRKSVYSCTLNHNTLTIHNSTRQTTADVTFYLAPKPTSDDQKALPFYMDGLGFTIANFNAHQILLKQGVMNDRLIERQDLEVFIKSMDMSPDFINAIMMEPLEVIVNKNPDQFTTILENLKLHSDKKGWIQGYEDIRILLLRIYHDLKDSKLSPMANELKQFLNDFEAVEERQKYSTRQKADRFIKEIEKMEHEFDAHFDDAIVIEAASKEQKPNEDATGKTVKKKKWWHL